MLDCNIVVLPSRLLGKLVKIGNSKEIVIFIHGSGSNRFSIRNNFLANYFNQNGLSTLVLDLFTEEERKKDREYKNLRFDLDLITERVKEVTKWITKHPDTRHLSVGYFSSSTGSAAAINASTSFREIKSIVSRSGRIDLLDSTILRQHRIPTMFIVGGNDYHALKTNKIALKLIPKTTKTKLVIIPNATHFFDEHDKIMEVAKAANTWFKIYLLNKGPKYTKRLNWSPTWKFYVDIRRMLQVRIQDRVIGGYLLTKILKGFKRKTETAVIAIPKGGLVVGDVISKGLFINTLLPLLCKRLRHPLDSERAIGAVCQNRIVHLDEGIESISSQYIAEEIEYQKNLIEQIMLRYKLSNNNYDFLKGKRLLVVDDGIHTGSTMIAAVKWLRQFQPKDITVATPIVSRYALERLLPVVSTVKYILNPSNFRTIEDYYVDFKQLTDNEIMKILRNRGA
jgi:predicted phosphoribosyltransferase/dienelactone hydrolase